MDRQTDRQTHFMDKRRRSERRRHKKYTIKTETILKFTFMVNIIQVQIQKPVVHLKHVCSCENVNCTQTNKPSIKIRSVYCIYHVKRLMIIEVNTNIHELFKFLSKFVLISVLFFGSFLCVIKKNARQLEGNYKP